jgi:hypothetical protein
MMVNTASGKAGQSPNSRNAALESRRWLGSKRGGVKPGPYRRTSRRAPTPGADGAADL